MAGLAWSDFSDKVGQFYQVAAPGGPYPLTLRAAELLSATGREGGAFRLEFLGPADPILPQATYAFAGDALAAEIFIVPLGRDAAGTRYEAIFY